MTARTLVLVVAIGACSASDPSQPRPDQSRQFDPAKAAVAIRALRQIDTRGEVHYGDRSGPLSAEIAYEPYRFRVRSAVPVARTKSTATFLGLGDRAWVQRAVLGPDDHLTVTGPLSLLMLRAPDARPYLELATPNDEASWSVTAMFDPARVLDAAANARVPFEISKSLTIDGTIRNGVRADLSKSDQDSTGLRNVTVWIDAAGLPLRLAAATVRYGEVRYDIRRSQQPLNVEEPDEASVQDSNVALPDATGPYSAVVETAAAGIPITVLSAPAARGWSCWKVASDPPFRGLNDARPSGGSCVMSPLPGELPQDQYAIPLTSAAGMPYTLLGFLFPPGSTVEFRRFAAEPVVTTTGPSGLAFYAGHPTTIVGIVLVRTPEAELICGPAGVDNEADFAAREAGGGPNDDLVGAPWNCLTAADARALGA